MPLWAPPLQLQLAAGCNPEVFHVPLIGSFPFVKSYFRPSDLLSDPLLSASHLLLYGENGGQNMRFLQFPLLVFTHVMSALILPSLFLPHLHSGLPPLHPWGLASPIAPSPPWVLDVSLFPGFFSAVSKCAGDNLQSKSSQLSIILNDLSLLVMIFFSSLFISS